MKTLQHEGEMPLVRLRVVLHEHEHDHEGLGATIGFDDGEFQGGIMGFALGLLHPVEHVLPGLSGASLVEVLNSLSFDHQMFGFLPVAYA